MLLNATRELGWIARHWKQIQLPVVAYKASLRHSGEYWTPDAEGVLEIDVVEIQIPHGAIILGRDPGPGTLAHEFRHHLQFLRGGLRRNTVPPSAPKARYFAQPCEADALGFELRMAPERLALTWAEELRFTPPSRADLLNWPGLR